MAAGLSEILDQAQVRGRENHPDSALVVLNRDGRLEHAPSDLIAVVGRALALARESADAFLLPAAALANVGMTANARVIEAYLGEEP